MHTNQQDDLQDVCGVKSTLTPDLCGYLQPKRRIFKGSDAQHPCFTNSAETSREVEMQKGRRNEHTRYPTSGSERGVQRVLKPERQTGRREHTTEKRKGSKQKSNVDRCFLREAPGKNSAAIKVGKTRRLRVMLSHVAPCEGAGTEWITALLARDLRKIRLRH